ncbi:Metallo-dependent phosphatase [Piromyces finnis]|uniref:Metallo-dependent phosphatase n=1 Tax=Piromyces finnis TaxID=1754191 RepID=A0A1Y1UW47_9FUNG|nr:Metallo-dependent phosphatase [Piromyces finnis]|eukprot:ORX42307.1 Metallo-dependent phosphatase [Piromyces finnis]
MGFIHFLLELTSFIHVFLSNAISAMILTSGNGNTINYNFHCFQDYNTICKNYKESLNILISSYNDRNLLLKNVNFEIFVDNLSDNGISQKKHVVNLDSHFQKISSKDRYPNYMKMEKMLKMNKDTIDIIMVYDNFENKQDVLNRLEFSLFDMMDDNFIQVLSGINAYDDGHYYGDIDDETPKEPLISQLNRFVLDNDFTKAVFRKIIKITNDQLLDNLFFNEEAISNPVKEPTVPWNNTLFFKEDDNTQVSNSNNSLTGHYDRIISFGDIHGDFRKLVKVLTAAKLINERKDWIAKNTALVQVGDLIDRGNDSKKILNLMIKLRKQAPSYGSDVFLLLGNHETMNIGGRYDYITLTDLFSYGSIPLREKQFSLHERYGYLIRKEMNATMVVGDTLFVHAGLMSYHLDDMTLEDINKHFHNVLMYSCTHPSELSDDDMYAQPVFVDKYFDDGGPTWTRTLFDGPENKICEDLSKTLKITKTNRMVVGHTVQRDGQIHTRCNNQLYFIDVGMSMAYQNTLAYLEFKKDEKEIWAKYD